MLNTMDYSLPGELDAALEADIDRWRSEDRIRRIWNKDASVWTGSDEAKWLGWLEIVREELSSLRKYDALRNDVESGEFTDVLLMGMGGSSLAPEVLAVTFGRTNFHILDSTVPAQVKSVEKRLDLERTLFIVASKSGSTLEPNCFKQYFFDRLVQKVGRERAGKQFVAITDPGSKMEQVAKAHGFRHIFYGKPDVGGRFSALSPFGVTAAVSMGIDVRSFLTAAGEMVDACRQTNPHDNPGAMLGLILGTCHSGGREKLTIVTSTEIYDLGAWMEQLIAESTGKNGVAIIPVDREHLQQPQSYGSDRVFAFVGLSSDERLADAYRRFAWAGQPVVRISMDSIETLGREFFRWEFATAVAGSAMGINPFDQPDVESAKIEARKITDEYEQTGQLPTEKPFFSFEGVSLFAGDELAEKLMSEGTDLRSILAAHVRQITPGDYFALLAYIEMNPENEGLLSEIRSVVLNRTGVATCLGFGPRFLHSTGQAYKGGPNTGVFLQVTSDDAFDLPVPEQKYTFGVVKAAQARGDFQVLVDRGRRALRLHIHGDLTHGLTRLVNEIT